LAKKKKEH